MVVGETILYEVVVSVKGLRIDITTDIHTLKEQCARVS